MASVDEAMKRLATMSAAPVATLKHATWREAITASGNSPRGFPTYESTRVQTEDRQVCDTSSRRCHRARGDGDELDRDEQGAELEGTASRVGGPLDGALCVG